MQLLTQLWNETTPCNGGPDVYMCTFGVSLFDHLNSTPN